MPLPSPLLSAAPGSLPNPAWAGTCFDFGDPKDELEKDRCNPSFGISHLGEFEPDLGGIRLLSSSRIASTFWVSSWVIVTNIWFLVGVGSFVGIEMGKSSSLSILCFASPLSIIHEPFKLSGATAGIAQNFVSNGDGLSFVTFPDDGGEYTKSS